jgi:hypothetical protein
MTYPAVYKGKASGSKTLLNLDTGSNMRRSGTPLNYTVCYALWYIKARCWWFGVQVLKHTLRLGAGLPTQRVRAWIAVQAFVREPVAHLCAALSDDASKCGVSTV